MTNPLTKSAVRSSILRVVRRAGGGAAAAVPGGAGRHGGGGGRDRGAGVQGGAPGRQRPVDQGWPHSRFDHRRYETS